MRGFRGLRAVAGCCGDGRYTARRGWRRVAAAAALMALGLPLAVSAVPAAAAAASYIVTAKIAEPAKPFAVAVSNGKIYGASSIANIVPVANAATNQVIGDIPVDSAPKALATDGTTGLVYVAGPGLISVVDPAGDKVINSFPGCATPVSLAAQSGQLYVACGGTSGIVQVLDAQSGAVERSINLSAPPDGIAVAGSSDTAYVTLQNPPMVAVIPAGSSIVDHSIPLSANPTAIAAGPGSATVYVTSEGNPGTVSVIDTVLGKVVATIPVGNSPQSVAVDPAAGVAFVVNSASATVSVIDTASRSVIATVPVGVMPRGVAVDPTTHLAYVTDPTNALVYVIGTSTVTITTSSLPDGTVGAAYRQSLAATGGVLPYRWSLAPGSSLPDGLTLSSDGTLSGTPTAAGTTSLTVRVTDGSGATATATLTLAISAAPAPPPGPSPSPAPPPAPSPSPAPGPGGSGNPSPPVSIATGSQLPDATVGVRYAMTLHLDGGIAPYRWAVVRGALPRGLRLGVATGVLSGVPAAPGTAVFTVQVNDSVGSSAQESLTLTVRASHGRLLIALSHVRRLRRGSTAAYRLRISTTARPERVTARIMLPPGLLPARAADRHWACSARHGRHAWVCTRQLLVPAGRPVVLTLPVRITVAARTVETARATVTAGRARASAVSRTHVR